MFLHVVHSCGEITNIMIVLCVSCAIASSSLGGYFGHGNPYRHGIQQIRATATTSETPQRFAVAKWCSDPCPNERLATEHWTLPMFVAWSPLAPKYLLPYSLQRILGNAYKSVQTGTTGEPRPPVIRVCHLNFMSHCNVSARLDLSNFIWMMIFLL